MGYNPYRRSHRSYLSQKLTETSTQIRPIVTTASCLRQIWNDRGNLGHVGSPELCPSSEGSTAQREDAAPDADFDPYTSDADLEDFIGHNLAASTWRGPTTVSLALIFRISTTLPSASQIHTRHCDQKIFRSLYLLPQLRQLRPSRTLAPTSLPRFRHAVSEILTSHL